MEDKYQTLQARRAEAAAADIPETDADGKPLTKKARAALIRAAEQVDALNRLFLPSTLKTQLGI